MQVHVLHCSLAKQHLKVIVDRNGTLCRLESTFKGDEKGLDDDFYQAFFNTIPSYLSDSIPSNPYHSLFNK